MSRSVEPLPGHPYDRRHQTEDRRRLQEAISAADFGNTAPRSRSRLGPLMLASLVCVLIAAVALGFLLYRYDVIDFARFNFKNGSPSARLSPSASENEVVIFSGDATELTAAPGNTVEDNRSAGQTVWIASSLRTAKSSGATEGVSLKIPNSAIDKLEARRIRVTISAARKEGPDRSAPFAVSYSAGGRDSGWRVFEPTSEFNDFDFTYVVPNISGGAHFVGIWADIAGRSIPLAVRRITVSVP